MIRAYINHAAMHVGLALFLAQRRRYSAAAYAAWRAVLPPSMWGLSPAAIAAFGRGSARAWVRYAMSTRSDEPLPKDDL